MHYLPRSPLRSPLLLLLLAACTPYSSSDSTTTSAPPSGDFTPQTGQNQGGRPRQGRPPRTRRHRGAGGQDTPQEQPLSESQLPPLGTEPADNLLLGNPSGATADPRNATNYLLTRPQFTTGYNAARGTPTWTSWHLSRTDITKNFPRQNDFRADPGLPRQFYQVSPQGYARSGFDKGHNCPSGDRTAALDDNSATFLMSNMVPQAPANNQQTWAKLEEYTRSQIGRGLEAYVIMGSYGRGGTGKLGPQQTLDQGRVTVPARIWKVVLFLPEGDQDLQRIQAGQQVRVLAVDTPNDQSISPDWRQYLVSVDAIEAATGLDIFSALSPATQATLQKVVDSGRAR